MIHPPHNQSTGVTPSAQLLAKAKALNTYLEETGLKPVGQAGHQLYRTATSAASAGDLTASVRLVTEAVRDYHVVRQQELTRREEIAAQTAIRLQELEQARALISQYLDRSFDERRENFLHLFEALDRAQTQGDTVSMNATLDGILTLAQSSPFISLAELKRRMAEDADFELEL